MPYPSPAHTLGTLRPTSFPLFYSTPGQHDLLSYYLLLHLSHILVAKRSSTPLSISLSLFLVLGRVRLDFTPVVSGDVNYPLLRLPYGWLPFFLSFFLLVWILHSPVHRIYL